MSKPKLPDVRVFNSDSGLSISSGGFKGTSFIHKFGYAPDFDTGDGVVSIWEGSDDGGINEMVYNYSSTADIDSLSSSSASDTVSIEVQGLDSNFDNVVQTITLTGQTRVALSTSLIRVFRLKNVGSTDLVGSVYCFVDTALSSGVPVDTSKVRALINGSNNQTLMALYTIPNGKKGYLRSFFFSVAGAKKSAEYFVELFLRPSGEVFQLKHRSSLQDGGSTVLRYDYVEPELINAQCDIELKVKIITSAITGAGISAGFDLVLVDD